MGDKECNDLSEIKKLQNKKNEKCKEILKAEKLFIKLIWNNTRFVVLFKIFVKVRKLRDYMSKNKINKKNGKEKLKNLINKKLKFLKPKKNVKKNNKKKFDMAKMVLEFMKKNKLDKNCFNKKGDFDYDFKNKSICEKLKNLVTNILKEKDHKHLNKKNTGMKNLKIILTMCFRGSKDKKCEILKKILNELHHPKPTKKATKKDTKKSDSNKKAINGPSHKNEDIFINKNNKIQKNKNKPKSLKETSKDILTNSKKPKKENIKKLKKKNVPTKIKKEKKDNLLNKVSGPDHSSKDIILTKELKKSIKKKTCTKKEKKLKKFFKKQKNKSKKKQ